MATCAQMPRRLLAVRVRVAICLLFVLICETLLALDNLESAETDDSPNYQVAQERPLDGGIGFGFPEFSLVPKFSQIFHYSLG